MGEGGGGGGGGGASAGPAPSSGVSPALPDLSTAPSEAVAGHTEVAPGVSAGLSPAFSPSKSPLRASNASTAWCSMHAASRAANECWSLGNVCVYMKCKLMFSLDAAVVACVCLGVKRKGSKESVPALGGGLLSSASTSPHAHSATPLFHARVLSRSCWWKREAHHLPLFCNYLRTAVGERPRSKQQQGTCMQFHLSCEVCDFVGRRRPSRPWCRLGCRQPRDALWAGPGGGVRAHRGHHRCVFGPEAHPCGQGGVCQLGGHCVQG